MLVGLVVGLMMLGGGSLGLASDDLPPDSPAPGNVQPQVEPGSPAPAEPASTPDGHRSPAAPLSGVLGVAAMAAAMASLRRRDRGGSAAAGLSLGAPPLVVFVPGHGQPQGSEAFADLIEYMGLDSQSVRHFDYRWVAGGSSATDASEDVGVDDAASALNSYVAGVAAEGRDVYLVGFSKGGATVAELVADWDDGRWGPVRSVVGAALLDPPIAGGLQGKVQSLGRRWGPIPDDGGYDPVHCTFLRLGCSDRRAWLGRRSGIEVVVIRNPKAGITSFDDHPPGLRVYNAADEGRSFWGQLMRNPLGLASRVAAAHDAVLHDRKVAQCVVAEMHLGKCDLPASRVLPRLPSLRAVRAPGPARIL